VVLPDRRRSEGGPEFLSRDANNLNALRLLAAFGVVTSHCALLRSGHESAEPLANLTYFNLGDYALIVFFFISGLTVSASFARSHSLADFVLARVLRIWPALFAVVLLTVFVVAPYFSTVPLHTFFNDPAWQAMLVKTFVLSGPVGTLPGLFDSNPLPSIVNGSPWTLRFEVICYAVLVLGSLTATRLGASIKAIWIPVATIAAGLAMIIKPAGDVATTLDHLLRFWFAFGLGAMTYQFRAFIPHPTQVAGLWVAVTGAIFIVSIGSAAECVAAILFVGAATLFVAGIPSVRLRRLTNRYDLSYGVYITAWPMTQILVAKSPGLSFATMLAVIMAMSLALAFVSWVYIEKPAMSWRQPLAAAFQRICAVWGRRSPVFASRGLETTNAAARKS
jgi:peptidoglycan/LPS O-acetylase OafA/YrhL